MPYDHISLEQKWQKFWEKNQVFQVKNPTNTNTHTNTEEKTIVSETRKDSNVSVSSVCVSSEAKPKKYILDMFPYPSGAGLHVGHPKGYTATDIVSRFYHARGFNVLHTMGWDAFGLPAENYAIKTGTHPAKTTAANIAVFKEQLHSLGFSYDWSREIDTTDPEYYRWTQWIFLELFKKGLAYEQDLPINYCPSCKTGLANEEVLADNTCDRCGTLVERRPIRQWVLKITEYADRLIEDLDGLDWPEGVKEMQRNWIGKSEGCEFRMLKDEGFQYSRASIDDFNKILEIRKETGFHTVGFAQEQFFVAKKNNEIAGFIRTQKYGDFTELGALYVSEDFRGEKLGYKLISYAIEHTDASEFYMDCKKELQGYYEKFGFTILDTPKPFQLEKLKKVWDFYGKNYTEQDILDITVFMTIKKDSTFPKLPSIEVYTTRVDTVYGMTYAVLAPDHPRVYDFITDEQSAECEAYITEAASRSDQDRTNEGKEKTGVFTGSYVVNPFNGESVPLWIADYVLGHYGTGAVMAVPAHDERDYQFWKKYRKNGLGIKRTNYSVSSSFPNPNGIIPTIDGSGFEEYISAFETLPQFLLIDGGSGFSQGFEYHLINSQEFDGELLGNGIRNKIIQKAESEGFGRKKVNYKLRDWLFSRQRYWGEPIPLIHIDIADLKQLQHITDISQATDPDLAYILKRDPLPGESCDRVSCKCGHIRELVIGGQVYSKIYDGLKTKIVIDPHLPLELPQVEKYEPAGDGQSPLATVPSFVNVKLAENLSGKRETNTMPQWGGSCWYYLRYMDTKNSDALASKEALEYWQNVDEYVGGAEHAVLHLLYARFWHKVLYDIGVVPTREPFQKLVNQGMILAYAYERADGGLVAVDLVEEKDGKFYETSTGKEVKQVVAKMSKSLKNVINPNDIVREYGADTLRLYEMSMGAFTDTAPWNPEAIIGVRRFLDKAYSLFEGTSTNTHTNTMEDVSVSETKKDSNVSVPTGYTSLSSVRVSSYFAKDDMKAMKLLHKTVKKVGEDIVEYKFNTAISALQILINEGMPRDAEFQTEWKEKFAVILHPFAPHMAEELYSLLGKTTSVYEATWPEYEEFMLVDDEVTIAVQVGGKLRGTFTFLNGVGQEEVSAVVRADEGIKKWLDGKEIVKEIFIPNKMLSIVVKG